MFKDSEQTLRGENGGDGNDLGFGAPEERGDFLEENNNDGDEQPGADSRGADGAGAAGDDAQKDGSDDSGSGDGDGKVSGEGEGEGEAAGEAEAESEGDDSEGGSEDSEAEPLQTRKSGWVPKHRFDVKNTKLKEAEARIAELEGKLASEPKSDAPKAPTAAEIGEQISALDADIAGAVKDADGDKVVQLLAQQRGLQQELITQAASQQTSEATAAIRAEQAYNVTVDALEQADERLDPNSTAYDEAFTQKVGSVASAFEATGKSPAEALLQAAEMLGIAAEEAAEEPASEPAKEPEPRKTDVKKNVETANRQPPDISKAGGNSTDHGQSKEIDVAKLSDADFDALPEDTLKRLRGDFA